MTLRQLEVFLAIARAHSYRQAAETLHTSQLAFPSTYGSWRRSWACDFSIASAAGSF